MSDIGHSAVDYAEVTLLFPAIGTSCKFYHSGAVDNRDLAALGAYQPPIFKHLEGGCNAGATSAKHGRQKFMGQVDLVSFPAIVDHQQPAGQPFLDLRMTVDQCRTGRLDKERMGIAKQ
jgi:hypothetical protein